MHPKMRLCLTPTLGPRIHGERSNNGAVGNGGLDNSGAKNREKGERNNQRGVAGDKNLNRVVVSSIPQGTIAISM